LVEPETVIRDWRFSRRYFLGFRFSGIWCCVVRRLETTQGTAKYPSRHEGYNFVCYFLCGCATWSLTLREEHWL